VISYFWDPSAGSSTGFLRLSCIFLDLSITMFSQSYSGSGRVNLCWSSPAQSFLVPIPTGIITVCYCLTSLGVVKLNVYPGRTRDLISFITRWVTCSLDSVSTERSAIVARYPAFDSWDMQRGRLLGYMSAVTAEGFSLSHCRSSPRPFPFTSYPIILSSIRRYVAYNYGTESDVE
jgi:hypothetical protein